jgi:hypothetical protein
MSFVRPFLVVSLAALAACGRAQAQDLAATSPFLPGTGAAAGVVTENAPLELRGIVGAGDSLLFAIYDPSSKQTRWVRLNEAGHAFTVKTHDEASDTVSLDYAGRSLSLRLPESKITPLALAPAPSALSTINNRSRRPDNADNAAQAQPRELSPEEAKRLENVATEVARRRALRNATQNGTPPPPPGNR